MLVQHKENYTEFQYSLKVLDITKTIDGKYIAVLEILPRLVVECLVDTKLEIPKEIKGLYARCRINDDTGIAILTEFIKDKENKNENLCKNQKTR